MKKQQSMATKAMDSTPQIKVHKTSSTIDKLDHHRIPYLVHADTSSSGHLKADQYCHMIAQHIFFIAASVTTSCLFNVETWFIFLFSCHARPQLDCLFVYNITMLLNLEFWMDKYRAIIVFWICF